MFFKLIKNPKIVLVLSVLFALSVIFYSYFIKEQKILGIKKNTISQISSLPSPAVLVLPSPLPTTSPSPKLSKSTYTIALFGDSMIDTMGENLDYLDKALKIRYPTTTFKLNNYGIGAQNVEQGLARWTNHFSYQTRNFPPITQINSDAIVLGSFAYNPFPTHDRNSHFLGLIELVNRAKAISANVYLLAEIGPLKNGFGKGPGGANWSNDLANLQAAHIVEQLEDAINVSRSNNVFLINAYQASLYDGKFADPIYVNSNDGIHPSVEGHILMANLIVKTINFK